MYLISQNTNKQYSIQDKRWQGDNGETLEIIYDVKFDLDKVEQRPQNLWRYQEALPIINNKAIISFEEGFTPLQEVSFGSKKVFIKLDYLFPSGSYKDRGATMVISHANALGIKKIVQDSSGNAGSAVACYCAKAEIDCEIYVPAQNSPSKLKQIEMYGARLHKVNGSREQTAQEAFEIAQSTYYASHVYNPFFIEGVKTFAYEVCEQLNWTVPDTIVLPAGNGSLILGTYKGFQDLRNAGITKYIPKIVAIQTKNCCPIYEAFQQNLNNIPDIEKKETIAEGIAIAKPKRGSEILDIVRKTNGKVLIVEEEEIYESYIEMARKGYYIEKTSSAIIAGLKQYLDNFASKDELVISTFTGNGLKSG